MLYLVSMKDNVRSLHRITINLIPKASKALAQAMSLTGNSITDTMNRAVQFYAWAEQAREDGGTFYVKDRKGNLKEIEFL